MQLADEKCKSRWSDVGLRASEIEWCSGVRILSLALHILPLFPNPQPFCLVGDIGLVQPRSLALEDRQDVDEILRSSCLQFVNYLVFGRNNPQ